MAAIETLGSLFKVTEVFLRDNGEASDKNMVEEPSSSFTTANINSSINHVIDDYTSMYDFELAEEMGALGLPISFCTTKQMNNISSKGRRKGTREKSVSANKGSENRDKRVPEASSNFLLEDSLSRVLHDSTNIPLCDKATESNIGASYYDVHEGRVMGVLHLDRESVSVSASILGDIDEKRVGDGKTDMVINRRIEDELSRGESDGITADEVLVHQLGSDLDKFLVKGLEDAKSGSHIVNDFHKQVLDNFVEHSSMSNSITVANEVDNDINNLNLCPSLRESSLSCPSADHVADHPDSSTFHEFGDWNVIWDPFYNRNYFYNIKSQESTWYPPPGLERFAFCSDMYHSNELSTNIAKEHIGVEFSCNATQDIDIHGFHYKTSTTDGSAHSDEHGTSVNLTTGGSAHSDAHGTLKKIADELVSPHTPDVVNHLDDSDVSAYRGKQEKQITSSESYSEPDASLELCISNSLTASVNGVGNDEDKSKSPDTVRTSSMDELDGYRGTANKKKKTRVSTFFWQIYVSIGVLLPALGQLLKFNLVLVAMRNFVRELMLEGVDVDLPANIVKYWCQRYSLFSQFDSGIKMDEEGWFSVTPESIARHHASRCGSGIIIDCFTGVGGNAIQFAKKSNHVVAIDIDPQKIDYARHNATIYGVSDCINFITSDFFSVAPRLKGDVVFMSPPWGGPDYNKVQAYDMETMLRPHDGRYLFQIARMIASKIVMFLPRNIDLNQLAELSLSVDPPWALEVEKNFLNGRLKAITAYFDNPSEKNA